MPEIPKDLGSGGSFRAPEQGGPKASLVEVLNGIAGDLAARSGITSPDATDLASVILLANEMKDALNVTVDTTVET